MSDSRQDSPDLDAVREYLLGLQGRICEKLEAIEPVERFRADKWEYEAGGGGISRVLENGEVFEKGGVNFSHVRGATLPGSASAGREGFAGKPFEAMGVSLVIHPLNPYVPTSHMNVRLITVDPDGASPAWWFGGGYDLTPYYGFREDCHHWHKVARRTCDRFDESYYPRFKKWCDDYFYLRHRDESRGIGGLFFDDFTDGGFGGAFEFMRAVGDSYVQAYVPVVNLRREMPYGKRERDFQRYRRGRYVEFNLVYDRGTLFGLQSGGRTESILMSLPPTVNWRYDWQPEPDSEEARLTDHFLKPRDWLAADAAGP